MKLSRVTAAMMMVSLSTPLIAASEQSVGMLTSATQGTFVAREGKMIPARAGQTLYAGDRVVTRGNANAKVSMSGCNYALKPTSMLSVGKGACSAAPRSMAVQDDQNGAPEGAPVEGAVVEGAAVGTTGAEIAVAVVAALALGAGIYTAADENDESPASP